MKRRDVDVLLVEDNPGDAKLVMMAFKKSNPGKKLVWLKDGEKARDYILAKEEANPADKTAPRNTLVLLDLTLPKMSGLELLKEIKMDPDYRELEIVVLTGSKKESDLVESYGYGVKTYIRKDIANKNCIRVICGEGHEEEIESILSEAYEEEKP